MKNYDEIISRLDIIRALESVKIRIESSYADGDCQATGYKLFADSERHEIDQRYTPAYSSRNEISGELPSIIMDINEYIKTKFKPLIEKQHEALKKLL